MAEPDQVNGVGTPRTRQPRLGFAAGEFDVPDDFDETPQWLIDAFEGADEDPATWQ